MYSDLVMEHFSNPRNVGSIPDPDGVGLVGNPVCGDLMKMFIKVKDSRIEDIKFQTFGCGAAIATSSMVTSMVKGKTLEEARAVKGILESKGVPCWLDLWGYDVNHDWPWWRRQMPYFLGHLEL